VRRKSLAAVRARVDRLSAVMRGQMTCSACEGLARFRWANDRAQLEAISREPPERCETCGRELLRRVFHWRWEEP
jgi:ribosomal protein L37AE/L43A